MIDIELLHSNPGFSIEIAHILAKASKLAYKDEDAIKQTAKEWGFSDCQFFSVDETQGFIASDSKAAVLSFRGSQSAGDWLIDIDVRTAEREYGAEKVIVHRGFARGYDSIVDTIQTILGDLPADRLWITGHSLGGALANLAAAGLLEFADQVLGIYTYGQPKVGRNSYDHLLKAAYKEKYFRIVNDTDLVPRLPRKYHHNGNILKFDADGNLPSDADGIVIINDDSWKSFPKDDGTTSRGLGTEESFEMDDEDELSDVEYALLMAEVTALMKVAELESAEFSDDEVGTRGIIKDKVLPFMRRTLESIPGVKEHDIQLYIESIETNLG
ncbi:MAG: triacylglycerol lipase [Cellvibrionaceae bacterium]|jgi:triacylglycerol lipase